MKTGLKRIASSCLVLLMIFNIVEFHLIFQKDSTKTYVHAQEQEVDAIETGNVIENETGTETEVEIENEENEDIPVDYESSEEPLEIEEEPKFDADIIISLNNDEVITYKPEITIDIALNLDEQFQPAYMQIDTNPDFLNSEWQTFSNSSQFTLPDQTGDYTIYIKFKDELDFETIIYFQEIRYEKYDIFPEIEANVIKEPLLGGDMEVEVTIQNTGSAIGYGVYLELDLPTGVSFDDLEVLPSDNEIFYYPTFVSKDKVIWQNITDLLPQESCIVRFKLNIEGKNRFEIGEVIELNLVTKIFQDVLDSLGPVSKTKFESTLQAYRIESIFQKTKQLVGSDLCKQTRTIKIQNNNSIPSQKEQEITEDEIIKTPVIIQEILDTALEYIPGSERILNLFQSEYVFNIYTQQSPEDQLKNILKLEWIVDQLSIQNYQNPLSIQYDVTIPYRSRDNINDIPADADYENNGEIIENNQKITINTDISALYQINNETVEFSTSNISSIQALYIEVNKKASKNNINPGDELYYEITLNTSQYYDFDQIIINDILPDGIEYIDTEFLPDQYLQDGYPITNDSGQTEIRWKLGNLENSSSYNFKYHVQVSQTYSDNSPIYANDKFINSLEFEAEYLDIHDDLANGIITQNVSQTLKTPKPEFQFFIWNDNSSSWTQEPVYKTTGDSARFKLTIDFPAGVDTQNYSFTNFLPPYTDFDNQEAIISYTGNFEFSPENYTYIDPNGMYFNFGKVDKNSTWSLEYEVEIQDNPNLVNSVILRNIARTNFENSDQQKTEEINKQAIIIAEPIIKVTKRRLSGYLQAGDTVEVEVKVSNIGLSTAYSVSLEDLLFFKTSYIEDTLESNGICDIQVENDIFTFSNCNITIENPFVYTYLMQIQDDVLHNTIIDSNSYLDDYYNHDPASDLPSRVYGPDTFKFNWRGEEAGIVTSIEIFSNDNILQDKIIRGQENIVVFSAQNVGKAPLYDFEYLFDNQIITNDSLILLDGPRFFTNSQEGIPDILYPKDRFYIKYHYQASDDLPLALEFFTRIEAGGKNLLGQEIRKSPIGMGEDVDDDDLTERYIKTGLLDSQPPDGTILFKNQDDYLVDFSNNLDNLWVEYEAIDLLSHITRVRFSDDGFNWYTIDSLPIESNCELDSDCNLWNGEKFKIHIDDFPTPISYEGRHYKYMQVFDFNHNSTIISNSFVFDQTPPNLDDGILKIGLYPFDLEDPLYTGQCTNHITYKLTDSKHPMQTADDVAKIESIKYSLDGALYSDWIEYSDNEFDTRDINWTCEQNNEELKIWLKAIDFAGNESENFLFDDILYFSYTPELTVSINDDQEFTNIKFVALKLQSVTHPELYAEQVRLKYCGTTCENEDFGPWLSYFQNSVEILKNSNIEGKKQICAQIKDNVGNLSDTVCDDIKLDTSSPVGNFLINNGNNTTRSRWVTLNLDISDPLLCDGQICIDGSGISTYQTSFDQVEWTNWQNLQNNTLSLQLPDVIGSQNVYLKVKDNAGNESIILADEIFIDTSKRKSTENDLFGGDIIINEDSIFTDFEVVTLDIPSYGSPTHMKIWNEGQDSANVLKEIYASTKNWELFEKENFGVKKVYVQFYKNSLESDIAYDEIIFAPIYSIEYELESLDAYTNESSQIVLYPYQEIDLNIGLRNTGSLYWQNTGDFPVNISYHVFKKCTHLQEHSECLENEYYPYMQEGLRSVISKNLGYMQSEQANFVTIQAPLELGDYKIQIDAVHEFKTWFSAHNNPTPEILIQVIANENEQEPNDNSGNVLGTIDDIDYQGHFGIGARKDYIPPIIMEYKVHGGIEINGLKYAKYVRDLSIAASYVDPQPYSSKLYYTHLEFYRIDEIDHEYNWWCDPKVKNSTYCLAKDKYKTSRIDARLGGLYDNDHKGTSMYWFEWFFEIRGGDLGLSVGYHYRNRMPETNFNGTYVMLQTVADRDRNKTYADPYFFVIDHSLDYQNPPSQTPAIEFDQNSMTPIVPGTACGRGDIWEDDALNISISSWKNDYTLQTKLSNDYNDLENLEWTNTLSGTYGQSTFSVTNSKATFHLPHTQNQPDGEMFWQARVIKNGTQIGEIAEYSYQVTNDLNHDACLTQSHQTRECSAISISTVSIFAKSGPSSIFPNKFEISHLATFEIISRTNVESTIWYLIENDAKVTGWVPGYFVSKNEICDPPVFIPNKPLPTYQKGYVCNIQDYIPIKLEPNWESGNLWKYNFAETRKRDLYAFKNYDVLIIEDLGEWKKVLVGPRRYIGYMHQAYICNATNLKDLSGYGLSMPFEGEFELTYPFAPRPDGFHYGDDFGIYCNTPIKAVYDGTVIQIRTDGIKAGNDSDMDTPANYIIVQHELHTYNSKNEPIIKVIRSYYWHLNEVWVEENEIVSQDQTIGLSGNTGFVRGNPEHELDRQGCHLHFEIREIDEYQNETKIDFARNPLLFLADQIDKRILQNLKDLFFKSIDNADILLNTKFGQGSLEVEPGKASIEANVIIKQNGDLDIRSIYYEIPPPIILNVEPNTKQNKVYIGGIAISEEASFKINIKKVTGQKSWCLINCDIYETSTQEFTSKIDQAYVSLFQKNSFLQKDKEFMDISIEQNGRWSDTTTLGTNTVQINDTVYAKTRVIDSGFFSFEGRTYRLEDQKDFRESKASNEVKIKEMSDENMRQIMKHLEKIQEVKYSDIKGMYDVKEDNYAYKHIKELIEDGILQGYSDGTFRPSEILNRDAFSVYLVRAFDIPFVENNSSCKNFPDVIARGSNYNFTKFIHALKCSGITAGYNNGTEYRPDETLDRGSASILLMKAMQYKLGVDFKELGIIPPNPFEDARTGNFANAVAFLSGITIDDEIMIAGYSDGTFRPTAKVSREQMAKFTNHARKFVENSKVEDSDCGIKGIVQDLGNKEKVYRSKLGTFTLKNKLLQEFEKFGGISSYGWPKQGFDDNLVEILNDSFPEAKDGLNKEAEWIDGTIFEKGIIGIEDDFPLPADVYTEIFDACSQEETQEEGITMEDLAPYLVRAFGVPIDTSCEPYTNLDKNAPYYEEITSLKCFSADRYTYSYYTQSVNQNSEADVEIEISQQNLTRGQVIKAIIRAFEAKYPTNIANMFFAPQVNADQININNYDYHTYVEKLSSLKRDGEYIADFTDIDEPRNYFSAQATRGEFNNIIADLQDTIVLDMAYFNQLNLNGTSSPADGGYICGAASSIISSSHFGVYDQFIESRNIVLRDLMVTNSTLRTEDSIYVTKSCVSPNTLLTLTGAFGMTNSGCNQSSIGGIKDYLEHVGLNYSELENGTGGYIEYDDIQDAIDEGNPMILSMIGFGHIFTIKGYGPDDTIIVNDSYQSLTLDERGGNYTPNGQNAMYRYYQGRVYGDSGSGTNGYTVNYILKIQD